MTELFKAGNGLEVGVGSDGMVLAQCRTRSFDGAECTQALREFFQHERDQELGRWRWPENPDYVVSLRDGGECVWVLNEREKGMLSFTREMSTPVGEEAAGYSGAAWAYFAAHPKPKPWHDAKPGEVWLLSRNGEQRACGVVERLANPNTFVDPQARRPSFPVNDEWIESARRIWPEVSDA